MNGNDAERGGPSADSINARLLRGELVAVGNKLYRRCDACGDIVRVNKPLFGSLHICQEAYL